MNKIELAVAEEANIETTETQEFELSLADLEMVGGGGMASLFL